MGTTWQDACGKAAPSLASEVSLGCLGMQRGRPAPRHPGPNPSSSQAAHVASNLTALLVQTNPLRNVGLIISAPPPCPPSEAGFLNTSPSGRKLELPGTAGTVSKLGRCPADEGKGRRGRRGTFQVAEPLCVPVPARTSPGTPLPSLSSAKQLVPQGGEGGSENRSAPPRTVKSGGRGWARFLGVPPQPTQEGDQGGR